jgi:hypothetical protein
MAPSPQSSISPPVVAALDDHPLLWRQAGESLRRQLARIDERARRFAGRAETLRAVRQALRDTESGLIAVEGPPGSGVTSLLCRIITDTPCAFWLHDEDGGGGAAALAAQVVALRSLAVPLVPPAAPRDARTLERLLGEAVHERGDEPLLLVVDAATPAAPRRASTPPPFPARLPPGVVLLYGCAPEANRRWPAGAQPVQRIALPLGREARADLLAALGDELPERLREAIARQSQGSLLYARLAPGLLRSGVVAASVLPAGLQALHTAWWRSLDTGGRRLALLLATASDPLPDALCRELLGDDPLPLLEPWGELVERAQLHGADESEAYAFYHPFTRAFVTARTPDQLASTHAAVAFHTLGALQQSAAPGSMAYAQAGGSLGYVLTNFARHAALGTPESFTEALPLVAGRSWVRFQKRRGALQAAASDAGWELWRASQSASPARMVRAAFLAGTLATLARALPPEAPAEILGRSLDAPNRDAVLKGLIAFCDQLPDGREKALTLRRLGEVCYAARMRTSAMRLLSQALDLEEQTPSRALVEEREGLQVALARAALASESVDAALAICERIAHGERRGLVQTEAVRALIAMGQHGRARQAALAIEHESMCAWAVAEVAVAFARDGDLARSDELLAALALDTALAWAQIELACAEARNNDASAIARIERLEMESQRDRGRARLAHALAAAEKDGDALHVASQIADVATRVTALLDLRLTLEGLVAMLALEEATAAINAVSGDDRVPLTAALAAAHAALGRRDRALAIAQQLAEGEERDRALARVAVALGGGGDIEAAQQLAASLADDDERDWAFEELTRLLAHAARWDEAHAIGQRIGASEPRARILADVYTEQARHGEPVSAYALAAAISHAGERARALTAIAPLLVAAGHLSYALDGAPTLELPDARSRYESTLVAALAAQLASGSPIAGLTWQGAHGLAQTIARPAERARALLALAECALPDRSLALRTLGEALHIAATSRVGALRCLEHAAPLLAQLGGPALLEELSAALDEIDSW